MGITAHFVFLFSSLTLGSCRSKSSTGGTERILIGCILTWLSSQTTEETPTSPTISSSKQASTGRRWLLEHKKDRKGILREVKAAHVPGVIFLFGLFPWANPGADEPARSLFKHTVPSNLTSVTLKSHLYRKIGLWKILHTVQEHSTSHLAGNKGLYSKPYLNFPVRCSSLHTPWKTFMQVLLWWFLH